MKREDIAYYYQPIVSAVTGKIRALEALMHVETSMLKSRKMYCVLQKKKNAFMIWKESLFSARQKDIADFGQMEK